MIAEFFEDTPTILGPATLILAFVALALWVFRGICKESEEKELRAYTGADQKRIKEKLDFLGRKEKRLVYLGIVLLFGGLPLSWFLDAEGAAIVTGFLVIGGLSLGSKFGGYGKSRYVYNALERALHEHANPLLLRSAMERLKQDIEKDL